MLKYSIQGISISMRLQDTYRHKGMRKKLVEVLRSKNIKSEVVLDAIGSIPRHWFLDRAFEEWAYKNVAFPIGSEQTISHPYTVAFQTELLEVDKGMKILEIGTGSGYQASVLSFLGAKVYSIERQKNLFDKTSKFLPRIGFQRIRTFHGDGYKGLPRFAPFDRILVTAGAVNIPKSLASQLKIDGYMIIPVGDEETQEMIKVTRMADDDYQTERFGSFSFVPFLSGTDTL